MPHENEDRYEWRRGTPKRGSITIGLSGVALVFGLLSMLAAPAANSTGRGWALGTVLGFIALLAAPSFLFAALITLLLDFRQKRTSPDRLAAAVIALTLACIAFAPSAPTAVCLLRAMIPK